MISKRLWLVLSAVAALALPLVMVSAGAARTSEFGQHIATPKRTFIYAVPGIPATIDYPFQGDPTRYVRYSMASTLFKYGPAYLAREGCGTLAPIDAIVGDLASKWSYSKDRKTITITLRNAKSPYGNTLSSADVAYSFDRMNALEPITNYQFYQIANYAKPAIKIINNKTFQIRLARTNSLALVVQTIMLETIVDSVEVKKHATQDDPWAAKWMANHTADYGPWKLESFAPGQKLVFVRNPNYTGQRGNITELILQNIPDPSTRAQLLQAGAVDWAERVPFQQFLALKGKSGIKTMSCVSPNRDDIVLQQKNDSIFANVDVRRAISLAIDRTALVRGAYAGLVQASTSGLSSNYKLKPTVKFSHNVALAKQLLAKAGHPNGFKMTLSYNVSRPGPWADQVAILVQSMLARAGITVELDKIAASTEFNARFSGGNYQAMLFSDPPVFPDPAYSAGAYGLSNSPVNTFGFKDARYDYLINTALHTKLGKARDKIMAQVNALGASLFPVIYLVDQRFLYTYRSNVTGFLPQPHGNLVPHLLSKR